MKRLILALFIAILTIIAMSVPAFADEPETPTTVAVEWDGSGEVTGTVDAGGDTTYDFEISAAITNGNFSMTDYNNNPYNYNVDSVNAGFNAYVSGGYAEYVVNHTDQYEPMYGSAGQQTFSRIGANADGYASMAMWTNSNYASMQEANYGHTWTAQGDTFSASSPTGFLIQHQVTDSQGEYANFEVIGAGTASVDCMSSDIGANSLTFGQGAGCYTDASYDGDGTIQATFTNVGSNSVTQFGNTVTGDGTLGSVSMVTTITCIDGTASVPNFAATVN
jgi:hypothetical protein